MSLKLPGSERASTLDPADDQPDIPSLAALPPKAQRFALAFLDCGNAAEAARQAGYKPSTPHAASVEGNRLLASAGISKAVADLKATACRRAHLSRDERVALLCVIARGGDPASGMPPTHAERIASLRLLNTMLDPPQRQAIDLASQVSYVVPLPAQIKDVDEWSAMAQREMAAHSRQTGGSSTATERPA